MELNIQRKLGRLPSKKEVKLKMTQFVDVNYVLPRIPDDFGHEASVPSSAWGMDLNDQLGCCVLAGAYHEHKLWNAVTGKKFRYTENNVLKMYQTVAGYVPGDPSTDNGTDMQAAASYRRQKGIPDSSRVRHKIDAYVALEPGNWEQMRVAMYLFGAAAIGMVFYNANWDQYVKGLPWDYDPRSGRDGGHYIPGIGERGKIISTVTWGRQQGMTRRCYDNQVDEAIAYVSKEYLVRNRKSPEGFDMKALMEAVKNVTSAKEPV